MKRKKNIILLEILILVSILSIHPLSIEVKAATSIFESKVASNGITVDGLFNSLEWSDAKMYSFEYNVYSYPDYRYDPNNVIKFYVKNDATMLYFGVKIEDVKYSNYCVLDIYWDVDKSENDSIGDFESYINYDSGVSSYVSEYLHNSETGEDSWQCCFDKHHYLEAGSGVFSEGKGTIVYEIAVALSNFKIVPGDNIKMRIDYSEGSDSATIANLTAGYITVRTAATTIDNHYFIDDKPVLTLQSKEPTCFSDEVILSWTAVEGADYYLVYRGSGDWDRTLVVNTTSTTAIDSNKNWGHPTFETDYVVVAVNKYGFNQYSNVVTVKYKETGLYIILGCSMGCLIIVAAIYIRRLRSQSLAVT